MIRVDFGLILGIFLEYILFIDYADVLFPRKTDKIKGRAIIGILYAVHFVICMFGNVMLNIAVVALVNFLSFILCYRINPKNAAFQSVMLVMLSTLSEWIIAFLPQINIAASSISSMNGYQSLFLTLSSKLLYTTGILISEKLSYKSKKSYGAPSYYLVSIPLLSLLIIILLTRTNINSVIFSGICFFIIIINLLSLQTNKKMIEKDIENTELKEDSLKLNSMMEEYSLMKDKYEKITIFRHDFKEHISILSGLISKDDEKAHRYINSILNEEKNDFYVKYTDNPMLNVLLTKKMSECNKLDIEFIINPICANMQIFNDLDIVSIFSNLINNAIESCCRSETKRIILNINTVNNNFIIIKIENTSDAEPFVLDGKLLTRKSDKESHGIGMNSIRRAIKKYNASLNWSYSSKEKLFTTTISIQTDR